MEFCCEAETVYVKGIVQGVGFRPFIYQLANRYELKGDVCNISSGVTINIEGDAKSIDGFINDVKNEAPPLSKITDIRREPSVVNGFEDFQIIKSPEGEDGFTLISPDVATCRDCLGELNDPKNRRYRYPFINCTNCGPRYTIVEDIPYDRPFTTMKIFKMCSMCQSEYDDPNDRRFHAQPNACPACGPVVEIFDKDRNKIISEDPPKDVTGLLKEGHIVAIKGLGGFHLAVDAENDDAVKRLRQRKHREEKPFALMVPDVESARQYVEIDSEEEKLLLSKERSIVLLKKSDNKNISDHVSPRNRFLGIMLPYTPLHTLLFDGEISALVMTSGNMSDEPVAIDNEDALNSLGNICDYFLMHNRDILLRSDDSITRTMGGETRFIRRSRGYIPTPVFLRGKVPEILACGAEQKNTICMTKDDKAFLSQHIGDLKTVKSLDFFRMTIKHMEMILRIKPEVVVHDLHPDYFSTAYAQQVENKKVIGVQHHHAHIVSCMAENQIDGDVIGLAFDGTGYGTDGKIWGGEVLIANNKSFERKAHLSYIPMPGGGQAVKEPWRMGVSLLKNAFGNHFHRTELPFLKSLSNDKLSITSQMIDKGLNAPLTSSMGRLFDGISAITGVRNIAYFEGQAAMELEMVSAPEIAGGYEYQWSGNDIWEIDISQIVKGVAEDVLKGFSQSEIGMKFHNTIIALFTDLCLHIKKDTELDRVVMSGGVFQNALLHEGLVRSLDKNGFKVFTHKEVPANDGGLSLGQAIIGANNL